MLLVALRTKPETKRFLVLDGLLLKKQVSSLGGAVGPGPCLV